MRFKQLNIGEPFKESYGNMIMYYIKSTKSKAICTKQEGYGNQRLVGGVFAFAPNKQIETILN